eukprot:TRINITY_DN2285_c1_g1_i1.p1 TRINITY_DN2285_c1_g1~~TRINITY_DN2285_c1_g1_i1.p1  ORF type:complete len:295 (-),score=71.39 TRINITY_DN2285_c1_g1_i1:1437-2321(-)
MVERNSRATMKQGTLDSFLVDDDSKSKSNTKKRKRKGDDSSHPKKRKIEDSDQLNDSFKSILVSHMKDEGWLNEIADEFDKPYFQGIANEIESEKKLHSVYPPIELIFSAYNYCSFENVKVVIIGQDPYHGPGQAMGLSFSVHDGVKVPPSLRNIYKELNLEYDDFTVPSHGNLESWAHQGVFMLNASLTVRHKKANSHSKIGWGTFTDTTIKKISEDKNNVVFLLWGRFAQSKKKFIDTSKHLVLETTHPSPFSANKGFIGSGCFTEANDYLKENDLEPIDWNSVNGFVDLAE